MNPLLLVVSLVMAGLVLTWRVREASRPMTLRKIVIPPLGMSTGLLMFVYPPARVPWSWAIAAFLLGATLFAYPVIKTSTLTRQGDAIIMKRSRAFMWILLSLVSVRLLARSYVEQHVDPVQTGSIFFLLAYGMIVRWRLNMFTQYRALSVIQSQTPISPAHAAETSESSPSTSSEAPQTPRAAEP